MIKIDIVKRVADQLGLKDREALTVVDTIINSIKDTIKEHGRMEIRNFGVFQVKQRKPRTGRNPRNKKEYPIFPRRVVTFKLGKELKDFSVQPGSGDQAPVASVPAEAPVQPVETPVTAEQ
jgi:integration host factor subunit beta